ncbi:MAG: restriction endonuclease subunit R, partial [Deferribacterota bacterium]|nr:restriction endonuclease subunit R [Deferribacterota bacterium]
MALYNVLTSKALKWRKNNYQSDYPIISEIMDFNLDPSTGNLRFLRKAQFEALENYWYLRLVEGTSHIFDLYKKFYNDEDLLNALNIKLSDEEWKKIALSGKGINSIFERIKNDNDFVKKYKLEALRETLSLSYPSYILALAMGAGKTILIGAIIATEFA